MTDVRGPDFLPYPLPERTVAVLPPPPSAPPAAGRWSRALDGVPTAGVVAIGSGLAAVVLLLVVSGLAGKPGAGAVVTMLAGSTSLVAGWMALKPSVPKDSRTLIAFAQTLGVLAAIVSVVVYAVSKPAEQVVRPPVASPTAPSQQQPLPSPTAPPVVPPGGVNGFGVPSNPGQPLSDDPKALGTLLGHVVDTAGDPIKGALVTIERGTAGDTSETPDCPTKVTTQTDGDGVYRQQLCQLGQGLGYTVTITVGKASARTTLFVNSGNTTVYDVILPR